VWEYLGFSDDITKRSYEEVSSWGIITPGTEVKKGVPLFPRIEK
jgi:hypothetical protein